MARIRKPILEPGIHYAPEGIVRATPGRLRAWADKFRKMQRLGIKVPVSWGHQPGAEPVHGDPAEQEYMNKYTAGIVTDMFVDDGTGALVMEADVPAVSEVQDGGLVYDVELPDGSKTKGRIDEVSVGIRDWRDGQARVWKDSIIHVALTTHPVWANQPGFAAMSSRSRSAHPASKPATVVVDGITLSARTLHMGLVRYRGPRGGKGWKDTDTGRIHYGDKPGCKPGSAKSNCKPSNPKSVPAHERNRVLAKLGKRKLSASAMASAKRSWGQLQRIHGKRVGKAIEGLIAADLARAAHGKTTAANGRPIKDRLMALMHMREWMGSGSAEKEPKPKPKAKPKPKTGGADRVVSRMVKDLDDVDFDGIRDLVKRHLEGMTSADAVAMMRRAGHPDAGRTRNSIGKYLIDMLTGIKRSRMQTDAIDGV